MKPRQIFCSLLLASLCLSAALVANAQSEIMTNEEVITLTKAGLSPSLIVGKIRTSQTNFDVSTDSMIKLKQAGVTDDIIAAMLEAKSGKPIVSTVAGAAAAQGDP